MARQKELARSARDVAESMHNQSQDLLNFEEPFTFTGYELTEDEGTVTGLFKGGAATDVLEEEGEVIFDHSCFYAESGGQIADKGVIENDTTKAEVVDVRKAPNGQFLHHVRVESGSIAKGDRFRLSINKEDRRKIRANHSSLHLLQSALKKVLGDHVAQAGSYVSADYGRFDFSHFEKISEEDLDRVEKLVNCWIAEAYPVRTDVLDIDEAKKTDAIALFDEKYEDKVRVVSMGDVSKEFCGGTHVSNTAELGSFKIDFEESIGSGIRRIQCRTKLGSYEGFKEEEALLRKLRDELKLKSFDTLYDRLLALKSDNAALNTERNKLTERVMNLDADAVVLRARDNGTFKYVVLHTKDLDYSLKDYTALIRNKLNGGVVFVVNETADRYSFAAGVGKTALDLKYNASDLVRLAASMANGKGGGKPDLAQAGGQALGNVSEIVKAIEEKLEVL